MSAVQKEVAAINSRPVSAFEVMDLNSDSLQAQVQHAETLRKYEARKRARGIIVPTAIEDVKARLRDMGHPVTLFGESHSDRRERLKEVIASLELGEEELGKLQTIINQRSGETSTGTATTAPGQTTSSGDSSKIHKEVVFTAANETLIAARHFLCDYSFTNAHDRILSTKRTRESEELQAAADSQTLSLYAHTQDIILNTTQYGDDRPLTSIRYAPGGKIVAAGSLSCGVKVMDVDQDLQCLASLRGLHVERVSAVSWHPSSFGSQASGTCTATSGLLAAASADSSCSLWACGKLDEGTAMDTEGSASKWSHRVVNKLSGHSGPVLACEFHPSGKLVATTSADYSWRLWDAETAQELLLQDGHSKECSSIAFQIDGSLAATTDYAGVVLAWDLRSGQQIHAFQGHVKKITSCCFNSNGFQIVTGGTDNTVRIWDLRKKKCSYILPAHNQIISDVRLSASGELLASASFDGTVKVWGTRDFRLLQTLSGHVGKVMSCDFSPDEKHIITAGFDRTVKLWAHKNEF